MSNRKPFLLLLCVATLIATGSAVASQAQKGGTVVDSAAAVAAGNTAVMQNAAQKGFPLPVVTSVSQSASVEAVLIPADLAKRIFGKEVSQNYAVIELIVSKRDPNAALIVHSVFLDDSEWLLRGRADCQAEPPPRLTTAQKANLPCQIASIESRLVRGELLDAQPWTARNWTMRSLVAIGSVGAGFAFPFSGDVAKGIASFNGVVVPGAATLWPDGTVSQINHISDFGFQTNKIIPKQSSDVIVGFFPIRRFLTPSFRDLFLHDPAALFVPGEMVADPKMAKTLFEFLWPIAFQNVTDGKPTPESIRTGRGDMLKAMLQKCANGTDLTTSMPGVKAEDHPDCKLQAMLNGISLNNIRVVVGGAMTVDVATIPATVYNVSFDTTDLTKLWGTTDAEEAGTITGVYLTGGVPSAVDNAGNPIPGITMKAVNDGSSDTVLHFTIKLTACISPDQRISIVVNKPQDASSTQGGSNGARQATTVKPGISVASTPFQLLQQPILKCAAAADAGGTPPPAGDAAPLPNPAAEATVKKDATPK